MEVINISADNQKEVEERVILTLKNGGLVVYPTETCYGLGVDATNAGAVDKLWNFKGERGDKPVLVAVSSLEMASIYVETNELFRKVAQKYWPGPVSIVAKSKNKVAEKVQGGKETVGIRMPDMPFILSVIELLGKPITSTSANISGGNNPYSLEQFIENTPEDRKNMVDLFIDYGHIPENPPSTVVDVTSNEAVVLRQGKVTIEV